MSSCPLCFSSAASSHVDILILSVDPVFFVFFLRKPDSDPEKHDLDPGNVLLQEAPL